MNRLTMIAVSLFRGRIAGERGYRALLVPVGFMLTCGFAQTSMATVVGACRGGAHYSTIQQALAHTASGGVVSICPGTYPEQVAINKNVTLTGIVSGTTDGVVIAAPAGGVVTNASDLFDNSPIAAQILVVGGAIAALNNLIVDGANNQISGCAPDLMGIYYQNSSGTINHVVTRNQALTTGLTGCQSGQGIFVESGYSIPGTADVTIQNSSVHGYQKNGITADGSGTTITISGNDVVGQGPTTGAAENGIQVSDGAVGSVFNNRVVDDIYSPGEYGASGILVYDSGSLTIQSNTVSNTQYGIVVYSDGDLDADDNTITSNHISATHIDDGIDICSNGNTVKGNFVSASDGAGIHIDSECTEDGSPAGNGNIVTNNTVNEACAGILSGNGTGNTYSPNGAFNVAETTFAGDACPRGPGQNGPAARRGRLAPQRHR